jgi:hypothetical protein
MILVRLVFQTRWGKAQQVVDSFKQDTEMARRIVGPNMRSRILTDLSGPFHTVVQEIEVESLAEWERMRAAMFSNPEFQRSQAGTEALIESGRTEFYTIEATLTT